MQLKQDPNARNNQKNKIARFVLGMLASLILVFVIWPNSFYYLVMKTFPTGSNFPYRAASQLGENGSVFFIKRGINSSNPSIRSLMVSTAIESYLDHHGGTPEIWEVIVELSIDTKWEQGIYLSPRRYLENYIYGNVVPIPGEKRNKRILYFPVEKVQWANEHIFKKPRNYRIPEELLPKPVGE